jgi:UDP-2,3-diacylglucosamine pyrophosphatase LpxH
MSRPNLLVLSDVHLGCDLVQHARPDAPIRAKASVRRDRELVALLDWYRGRPHGGRPWRLVIAGDLVDFVGMSVSARPDEIETELTDEERKHGLGSAVDHTVVKLRRVAAHHHEVFAALARFVADGNSLAVLRGNHDVDFHWGPVQDEFRAALARHGKTADGCVDFIEWFYYEQDRIYIEHGHQYDDYCSQDHVMHPVMPSDPRRSYRSLSDILLRYVVRPTRGMSEVGHDSANAFDYLRFALRLGWSGMLALGRRFLVAIAALVAVWREHFSDAARWVRQEHERKLGLLAEARQISVARLRALAGLQRLPITRSLVRILAGVMVDRVAIAVVSLIALVFVLITRWTIELGIATAIGILSLAIVSWLWRRARGAIDASQALREGAARVATVFPAAFIVMGHTHLPEVHPAADGEAPHTYVNLGAWAEEDPAEGALHVPASRTHLVVYEVDGQAVASLLTWDAEAGPQRFRAA